MKKGKAAGYYKTTGASFGLQAGGQQYGYAMFFMNEKALAQLDSAKGFEVGVGPSIVLVDEGMAKTTTTSTHQGGHRRVRLRTEGADGRPRDSGEQDLEDHPEVAYERRHPGRAERRSRASCASRFVRPGARGNGGAGGRARPATAGRVPLGRCRPRGSRSIRRRRRGAAGAIPRSAGFRRVPPACPGGRPTGSRAPDRPVSRAPGRRFDRPGARDGCAGTHRRGWPRGCPRR